MAGAVEGPPAGSPPVLAASSHGPASKLLAGANPPASIPPTAAFDADCGGQQPAAVCDAAALADIDAARATEGYGPLVLPRRFESLGTVSQLIVVTNLERTSRGLPAFTPTTSLDALAQVGALANTDPSGPKGATWGGNASWGYATALAADYGWMYDDGPGSPNVACPHPGASGCWGHRHNILADWDGHAGGGVGGTPSDRVLTELFVKA